MILTFSISVYEALDQKGKAGVEGDFAGKPYTTYFLHLEGSLQILAAYTARPALGPQKCDLFPTFRSASNAQIPRSSSKSS